MGLLIVRLAAAGCRGSHPAGGYEKPLQASYWRGVAPASSVNRHDTQVRIPHRLASCARILFSRESGLSCGSSADLPSYIAMGVECTKRSVRCTGALPHFSGGGSCAIAGRPRSQVTRGHAALTIGGAERSPTRWEPRTSIDETAESILFRCWTAALAGGP